MAGLVDGDGQIYLNQKSVDLIVDAIKGWLSRRGNDHWLMVLDNVDDLESFRISDFFPANITGKIILTTRHDEKVAAGKVILTTRRSDAARFGEDMRLDVMEEDESIELLFKCCRIKGASSTSESQ
jgi:hypothetical protein